MAELKKCRTCGVDVPTNAPFGHCPKCLLELGFGTMPKDAEEPADPSVLRTPNPALGTVRYFGDYELLEQIGRGGMGIVYKAQQRSLNRIVALKMISAGEFASPAAVQRFQIEAEAAAKLDHPNIVPIYEIGVHRGQHYFSMKFVEGRSLAEEIRAGKFRFSTGGNPPGKAAERERQSAVARLMTTVAHSVHYAHQHGVLHRDLKPGNILLDAEGQPYLTDFGLAKILEQEVGVTQSAETMGTPSYMSPEQAAGQSLTTATDVYSLGAILYELLTGRPPFVGASALEVLQQLAGQEPVPPPSLNPAANRDLATICLKCLEKDPVKRYASTEHLADELVRFLKDEPIQARPVSQREKAWRWCRRKPGLASALAALVLIFVLGYVGVFWQWGIASRAAARSRQTDAFLKELLRGVGPSFPVGRQLRKILDQAAVRVDNDFEKENLESMFNPILGGFYFELGEYTNAETRLREALAHEKRTPGPKHPHLADVLNNLGWVLHQQSRLTESEAMHREALAMRKTVFAPEHPAVADSLYSLALVLHSQGRMTEAEAMQRDSLAMRKKLLGSDHPDVADSLGELASILQAQGKLADAETFAREALAIRKTKLGNEHEDVAGSHDILAEVLKEEGKFADAEPELLEANRIWQKREDAGPKMKRNSIEKLSKFYSAWVAATPDSDRIAKAREWKAKLVEFDAASAQNGSPTVEK